MTAGELDDALLIHTLSAIRTVLDANLEREHLRTWADQLIDHGHTKPSVCTIALDGLARSDNEVRHLAKLALREIGTQIETFAHDRFLLSAYVSVKDGLTTEEADFCFLATWGGYECYLNDDRLWPLYILSCGIDDIRSGMGFSTHIWGMTEVNWKQVARAECERWLAKNANLAEPALSDLRKVLK